MTLDLDELERKATFANTPPVASMAIDPAVVLALIERVRAAEIVGSEWMALQEAAGFPKDGMVRSVKDVSDSVVLMAERLREAETSQACEHGISGPRCFECPDGVTQHWAGVRELQERVREMEKRDREWQASTGLMHPETDG